MNNSLLLPPTMNHKEIIMEKNTKYAPGKNPKSLENLKKRPRVPNPNGRPRKELCLTSLIRVKLNDKCPYDPGKTWGEYIVRRWLELATDNATYFKELIERLEGKVTQPIEGQINAEVTFTIGKGYADDKPDIQPNKQDTG